MKCILIVLILSLAVPAAIGQTATAGMQGTVLDAKTQKPVSAAWVIANRVGAPPLAKHTKSGGDGAFQISGLTSGNYSICVQAEGDHSSMLTRGEPAKLVSVTSGVAAASSRGTFSMQSSTCSRL